MSNNGELALIEKQKNSLKTALNEICMARTPLELEFFVACRHVHPMRQYKQLITELQVKYDAVKGALNNIAQKKCDINTKELEIKKLSKRLFNKKELEQQKLKLEIEEINNGIEQTHRAMKGALRECVVMYKLVMTKYKKFLNKNEEELLVDEMDYWVKRLGRQAQLDIQTAGKIQWGDAEAILMLPIEVQQKIIVEALNGIDQAKVLEKTVEKKRLELQTKRLTGK